MYMQVDTVLVSKAIEHMRLNPYNLVVEGFPYAPVFSYKCNTVDLELVFSWKVG